jgi:gamma-glutamyl-gamma-aminobutyrate hydrolase PuuD
MTTTDANLSFYVIGTNNGHNWVPGYRVNTPDKADVLVWTGGSDISPHLYDHKDLRCHAINVSRDREEVSYFLKYPDKLKVGICRGAQLLNVLSGGSMIQHVDSHNGFHAMQMLKPGFATSPIVFTNSIHHQMMIPIKKHCEIIAKTPNRLSTTYIYDESFRPYEHLHWTPNNLDGDPEILYYHNTNSLCIQGHPEMLAETHAFVKICKKLVKHYHQNG